MSFNVGIKTQVEGEARKLAVVVTEHGLDKEASERACREAQAATREHVALLDGVDQALHQVLRYGEGE